jgi:transcriptional regulator with XRE-family HTH domain
MSQEQSIADRFFLAFAGKTQNEIASILGKTQQAISQWKVGRCSPTIDDIRKVAEITGRSVSWLMNGEEEAGQGAAKGVENPPAAIRKRSPAVTRIYEVLGHPTQTELGKMLGISQQTISQWNSGRSSPTTTTLQRIAKVAGVPVDYLLTGRNPGEVERPSDLERDQVELSRYYAMGIARLTENLQHAMSDPEWARAENAALRVLANKQGRRES